MSMFPVLIEFGRILFGSIWSGFLLPGEKAKTETWFDVDKGLKTKNEMETTSSDESGNRSEAINLVRMFDSGTLNQLRPCRGKGNKRGANTVTAK